MHNTRTLSEALEILETEDFSCIVEDIRQQQDGHLDLAKLLASTSPGTRIVAVASTTTLPDSDYWYDQGVKVLYSSNPIDLSRHLIDYFNMP